MAIKFFSKLNKTNETGKILTMLELYDQVSELGIAIGIGIVPAGVVVTDKATGNFLPVTIGNSGALFSPTASKMTSFKKLQAIAAKAVGCAIENLFSEVAHGTFNAKKKKKKSPPLPKGLAVATNDVASPAQLMALGTVPLIKAKFVYQPVVGTSPNSVYYLLGKSPWLNIAGRYLGNALSIRVEGNIEKFATKIMQAGLQIKPEYASGHFTVKTECIAARTFGAVMSSLDQDWTTPLPKFKHIVGKGA